MDSNEYEIATEYPGIVNSRTSLLFRNDDNPGSFFCRYLNLTTLMYYYCRFNYIKLT